MLFLLNDVVLRIDGVADDPRLSGDGFRKLEFPAVLRMGQELFAREPLLPRTNPARALRLAALIQAKAPMINAALFITPVAGCQPHEVTVRFVAAQFEVMAELFNLQRAGTLDTIAADRRVWRRLAA
jgi:hypothetical protein